MQITIFSVWMTFVWCNIFIVLCYILRKRSVLLNLSSMTGIIILYLFCLIRLAVPVELPWTKVVSGGSLYNFLYQIFGCEITCVAGHEIYVYHIFVVAWGVVMAVLLTRYLIQYHRVVSYFSEMEKTEDTELNNILDEICTDKEKRNIKIVQTAVVEVPCCMGILEKRILIPDKKYSREELHYIILHEYTHLDNKDILTIQLINILCIVFWWNPFVYILKGDMYQSIEIRCDQTVTKKLKSAERGNYLAVILKEYKASVQEKEFRKPAGAMPLFEDHSDHLIERFRLVAEGKQSGSRIGRILVPVIAVALLVLSYSLILQPRYDVPENTYTIENEFEDINQDNAYLYVSDGKYYLHCEQGNVVIDKQSMDHRGHFLPTCGNIPPVAAMLFFLKFQYPEQAVSQMQHCKTTEKLPGDSAVPGSIVRAHNKFRSRKNRTYLSDRSKRNHPQNFGYGQRVPEYTRILHQRVLHSVTKNNPPRVENLPHPHIYKVLLHTCA